MLHNLSGRRTECDGNHDLYTTTVRTPVPLTQYYCSRRVEPF